MSIHLGDEDIEQLLNRINTVEKTMGEIRGILSGRFEIKKQEEPDNDGRRYERTDNGPIQLDDIDVSGIQFKQKAGARAQFRFMGMMVTLKEETP